MANKRDYRFEERERWRDNPYRPHLEGDRQDYERNQHGQSNEPEYYGEHRGGNYRGAEPDWQRRRTQEQWAQRDDHGRYAGERHYGQNAGEQYRDRPFAGSSSYAGRGGIGTGQEHEHEPYHEGREGFGASSVGATWGAADTGRHRLGSLTDSAADSAHHLMRQQQYGRERVSYAGRGPKGYKRSDERIREDVSEVLTRSHDVDATNIEVTVSDGIVMLAGSVDDRHSKRMAEDLAQEVSGVRDVQNQIRVQPASMTAGSENKGPGASDTSRSQNSGSVLGLSAEAGGRK